MEVNVLCLAWLMSMTLVQSKSILELDQAMGDNYCQEFVSFRKELHSALDGLKEECGEVAQAYQCVIPTVEILKQCLDNDFVTCAQDIYKVNHCSVHNYFCILFLCRGPPHTSFKTATAEA